MEEIVNGERLQRLRAQEEVKRSYEKAVTNLRHQQQELIKLQKAYGQSEQDKVRERLLEKRLESLSDRRNEMEDHIFELDLEIDLVEQGVEVEPESDLKKERDVYTRHAEKLDQTIGQLINQLERFDTASSEIDQRRLEITLLTRRVEQLAAELQRWSTELDAPTRVSLIQSASHP
jgi:hypothetical protein